MIRGSEQEEGFKSWPVTCQWRARQRGRFETGETG